MKSRSFLPLAAVLVLTPSLVFAQDVPATEDVDDPTDAITPTDAVIEEAGPSSDPTDGSDTADGATEDAAPSDGAAEVIETVVVDEIAPTSAITDLDPTRSWGDSGPRTTVDEPLVHVISTREDIVAEFGETVGDLVDGAPGVHLQSTNRGAGAPIVRGQVGPEVLLVIDGLRYSNPTFRTGPNQYLNMFDPYALDRVELVRGTESVQYGSDAVGVIHLVPAELLYARGLRGGVTLSGGTADASYAVSPHVAYSDAQNSVLGNVTYGHYGIVRAGGGEEQLGTDYDRMAANLRYGRLLADHTELQLSYYGAIIEDAGRTDNLYKNNYRAYNNDNHMVIARVVHEGEGLFSHVDVAASYNALSEDVYRNDCATAPVDGLTDVNGDPVDNAITIDPAGCVDGDLDAISGRRGNLDDTTVISGRAQVVSELTEGLSLTWGVDGQHTGVSSEAYRERSPDFERTDQNPNFSDGSTALQLGAYAVARYELELADRVRLVPEVAARGAHFGASAPDIEGLGDIDYAFEGTTGAAQTTLIFANDAAIFASWNQGFRAPNLQESTTLGDTGSTFEVPNPDLGPERSDLFEVGTRLRLRAIDFDISGYALNVRDYIQGRYTTWEGAEEIDGTPVREKYNADNAQYYGAEAAFETMSVGGLSFTGDVSWIQGDITSDDETEPARRVPPVRYSVFANYANATLTAPHTIFASIGVRGAGDQTRVSSGDEGDLRICESSVRGILASDMGETCDGTPGWQSLDASVGYDVESLGLFKVELRNILDENYRYHGSGWDAAGFGAHFVADLHF